MEGTELEKLKGKNWLATLMLCWTLGTLGAHRFYTGKNNTAWAMLVLTITGCLAPISILWTLVDGVVIALGQFRHEDGSELYERIPWLGYVYIALIVLAIIGSLLYGAVIFSVVFAALTSGAGAGAAAGTAGAAVTP